MVCHTTADASHVEGVRKREGGRERMKIDRQVRIHEDRQTERGVGREKVRQLDRQIDSKIHRWTYR